MTLFRHAAFFVFTLTAAAAGVKAQTLAGPGAFASGDILEFIATRPSAVIKDLTITDRLAIPYEQETSHIEFINVTFDEGLELSGNKNNITFKGAVFNGIADFYLAGFANFDCEACRFNADANFHSVEAESLWLNNSVFQGHVIFVNARIRGLLNMSDVSFNKSVDFSGATIGQLNAPRIRNSQPINILWEQFGDAWLEDYYSWALVTEGEERQSRLKQIATALRFWQRNFQQLGLRGDELAASYELNLLKRKYFFQAGSMEWFASILLELPSRYGTRPFRPLIIGCFVIVLFGLFYWIKDPFQQQQDHALSKQPVSLFSFLYSLDTFIPLINITGIKQWGWVIKGEFRWLELIERVLGLTITTLAAYSIGSHFF